MLRPKDGVLVLSTMVYADEVNDPAEIGEIAGLEDVDVSEKELDMARQLIASLSDDFDAEQVRGHLPQPGARPHRAQGGRRQRSWPRPRRWPRTRSSTSWPRSRRA